MMDQKAALFLVVGIALMVCLASARGEGVDPLKKAIWRQEFTLADSMQIYDFPEDLVSYRVEFPAGKLRAENLTLLAMGREPPEPVAFQLSGVSGKNGFLEQAAVSFRTDLPKAATRRFVLACMPEAVGADGDPEVARVRPGQAQGPAPTAGEGVSLVDVEPGTAMLAGNLLHVKVPRPAGVLKAPVPLAEAPAPLLAVSRAGAGDGASHDQWIGAGSFVAAGGQAADLKLTALTGSITDAGPLFATYRLAYEFTGGRKYSVDLIVRHNETFVTIDEHLEGFAPEDGVFFRFDLVPGFDPDRRDVMNNGGYNQYSGAFDKGAEGFLPFGTGEQRKGKLPLELGLNTPNSYGIMRSIAFYRDAGPHAMLLSLYRLRDWQTARRMVWYDTWGQSNLMFFCEDGHKYLLASLQGSERHWAMAIIPREAVVHTAITDKKSHTAGPEVRLWQKLSDFSLNKVKDMCFDWDESTQRQLSDGGEQITYDDWLKNYGMNAQYWFLNAIVNLYWDYSAITGPPSFRGMPRWYGDYDASRAAWTPEQRRHVRSILVWMAESCEDDNNIPHHGMMGGHPNFIMDVKHTIPIACAVLHDHPHAKQWRQSFQKFFDEWIATYQRDPDPEHNAIGGRWTENIACYSGTALVATLHCHKALRKFDGGRPGRTDLLDHPRIRSWIAWYLNAMMSPHEGVRLVPPEGAHSRALEPGNEHSYHSALFEIARLMKNSAPELSEQMRWIETNGREGTKPPLWSVLVADYGPVLRYDFGGPHESYLHLMQIAGPWNYRWGQGHSVLYYGAKNTACSHNTMEEAGDEWKFDNITSFTVGGRGLGRRATDQPLYDFGFAQFYRALAGDNSPCVARGMMLLRDDYIVLHDDVKGDAEGKFVWASVFGFPQIYQLKPGARDPQGSPFTEATSTDPPPRPNAKPPRTARIRRYAGKGDFLTVVAPQPVKAEATPFGAVVNGNEFILCADANQRQDDGKLAFDGTFGYGREGQLALFEGTRIKLNGFGLRREGGDFGASADATGKGITGRVAGREGGTLCVTPPARLNSKNPKVTIDGRPVPCTMRDGEIRFDVTISLRDGCKEFEIQF